MHAMLQRRTSNVGDVAGVVSWTVAEYSVLVVPMVLVFTVFSEWLPLASVRESFFARQANPKRWIVEKSLAPADVETVGLVWPLYGSMLLLAGGAIS
jgi:hypothetical protein